MASYYYYIYLHIIIKPNIIKKGDINTTDIYLKLKLNYSKSEVIILINLPYETSFNELKETLCSFLYKSPVNINLNLIPD